MEVSKHEHHRLLLLLLLLLLWTRDIYKKNLYSMCDRIVLSLSQFVHLQLIELVFCAYYAAHVCIDTQIHTQNSSLACVPRYSTIVIWMQFLILSHEYFWNGMIKAITIGNITVCANQNYHLNDHIPHCWWLSSDLIDCGLDLLNWARKENYKKIVAIC